MATTVEQTPNSEDATEQPEETSNAGDNAVVTEQDDLKPVAETKIEEVVSNDSSAGETPRDEEEDDKPGCCARGWVRWRPFWHTLIWSLITA